MTENNNESKNQNLNQNLKNINCKSKIEYLQNELLDSDKCREFSEKLCDYIKNSKKD